MHFLWGPVLHQIPREMPTKKVWPRTATQLLSTSKGFACTTVHPPLAALLLTPPVRALWKESLGFVHQEYTGRVFPASLHNQISVRGLQWKPEADLRIYTWTEVKKLKTWWWKSWLHWLQWEFHCWLQWSWGFLFFYKRHFHLTHSEIHNFSCTLCKIRYAHHNSN